MLIKKQVLDASILGIDEEITPGISNFKLGINGDRYKLLGVVWN